MKTGILEWRMINSAAFTSLGFEREVDFFTKHKFWKKIEVEWDFFFLLNFQSIAGLFEPGVKRSDSKPQTTTLDFEENNFPA